MGYHERNGPISPAGVLATACMKPGPDATRAAPAVIRGLDQLATRESRAWPFWVGGEARITEEAG